MIQAIKGTRDILPGQTAAWQRVEAVARELFGRYGYREIRTPVFEATELFARGIGADTDVVAKEMYTFSDRGGDSLTLRPENTAGIMRAVIEHSLHQADPALRVWAMGPMFRAENVQKGRQRQFHQVDVEAFGVTAPGLDAEVVEMAVAFLEGCGLADTELILNSVGDPACRPAYVEVLRGALRERKASLCADCQRRTETNPLRVLDCKVPADQAVIESLPRTTDHLCADCRDHFAIVTRELDLLGIRYRVSHRLVRGLDYYTRTTFEITSGALGAQNTVLGGGRYDGLAEELDGPRLPGIGFALGVERLLLALPETAEGSRVDVWVAVLATAGRERGLRLVQELRRAGLRALIDHEQKGLKAQMKRADKLGARYALLRGDDEVQKGVWTVRDMTGSAQEAVADASVVAHIRERIHG